MSHVRQQLGEQSSIWIPMYQVIRVIYWFQSRCLISQILVHTWCFQPMRKTHECFSNETGCCANCQPLVNHLSFLHVRTRLSGNVEKYASVTFVWETLIPGRCSLLCVWFIWSWKLKYGMRSCHQCPYHGKSVTVPLLSFLFKSAVRWDFFLADISEQWIIKFDKFSTQVRAKWNNWTFHRAVSVLWSAASRLIPLVPTLHLKAYFYTGRPWTVYSVCWGV